MMNLRHIEVFHAVYELGSVSGAARELNVSQPSISKVLRHAESRIGIQLFRTVRGRLVPTDEAHVLFRESREIFERMESLQQTTRNLRRGGSGHIGVAVLPALGLDVVPGAILRFQAAHPSVTFDIGTCHKIDIARLLLERRSDIAVAYDAPNHPRLALRAVGEGELVALFRRADFPDPPQRLSLEAFDNFAFIAATDAGVPGGFVNSRLPAVAAKPATTSAQTYYVAAALVRRGGGFTVVDEFTARFCADSHLDYRPLVDAERFTVYAIYLADKPLSRLESGFLNALAQAFSQPLSSRA